MKVYFQHHGNLKCDIRRLLSGTGFATRQNPSPEVEWYDSPVLTILIDHPDGRFLFDTACPTDWRDRWAGSDIPDSFLYDETRDEEFLEARLNQLGRSVGDIDTVIASHLHYDHAGNLPILAKAGATILVDEAEWFGALALPGAHGDGFVRADYDGVQMRTVRGDTEIVSGLTLLSLPGHTWGTMGLFVDLSNSGPIIYTGDAVYMRRSFGPPELGSIGNWSSLDWLRSVQKVRTLAERTGATIVFGHDQDAVRNTLRLAPSYYD
ncbi:MAG TPA: N-acyl homoserine lactonase family protein [Pseudonocardiaceae bacterium]|jgi:glyoxylase-like metal-dependent hydrolase (beta-lactamase superfamily II)|nr:N-acyl homoserine lactonase family protein [Pseudonocardiaceae bacterium]